jgi:hypothetical protein
MTTPTTSAAPSGTVRGVVGRCWVCGRDNGARPRFLTTAKRWTKESICAECFVDMLATRWPLADSSTALHQRSKPMAFPKAVKGCTASPTGAGPAQGPTGQGHGAGSLMRSAAHSMLRFTLVIQICRFQTVIVQPIT